MNSKEIARNLLAKCGCNETSYEGASIDLILSDLNEAFPLGYYPGCANVDLAKAIYEISTTDRGYKKPIEYAPSGDASHCGATDLYPEVEQRLRELIDCNEPFVAEPLSSKKEICSWSLSRHLVGGPIAIHVWCGMDEYEDLVYDATPDGVELSEAEIEDILDVSDGAYEAIDDAELQNDATLETILDTVSELVDSCNECLEENYSMMKALVQDVIDHRVDDEI